MTFFDCITKTALIQLTRYKEVWSSFENPLLKILEIFQLHHNFLRCFFCHGKLSFLVVSVAVLPLKIMDLILWIEKFETCYSTIKIKRNRCMSFNGNRSLFWLQSLCIVFGDSIQWRCVLWSWVSYSSCFPFVLISLLTFFQLLLCDRLLQNLLHFMIHTFCLSGIQTGHTVGFVSLLCDSWGLSWED